MPKASIREKMAALRQFCQVRYEDLDCGSEQELEKSLDRALAMKKVAVHGRGDSWTEVGPGYNPYQASDLTTYAPEFGGRWRDNFPGSGDEEINDDNDKQKSTRNDGNEDFDSVAKKIKINEYMKLVMKPIVNETYILKVPVREGVDPQDVKKTLGDDAKFDGRFVRKTFTSFEEAIDFQKRVKDSIVEKKPDYERNR